MMSKKIALFLIPIALFACKQEAGKDSGFSQLPLPRYGQADLTKDFDLMVNSLKEAHTGLYWYSTPAAFDSVAQAQRSLIKDSLNGLEFYNIAAPVISFTREDHCDISLPGDVAAYLNASGKFLPLTVINLGKKPFILNDPDSSTLLKGWQLMAINGRSVKDIYHQLFNSFAADGFIESSKYRFLDIYRLSLNYAKVVGQKDQYEVTARDPETGTQKTVKLQAVPLKKLSAIAKALVKEGIIKDTDTPASLTLKGKTAILTFNTFSNKSYRDEGMDFRQFVRQCFDSIQQQGITDLILDMRENGGGTEGNEDYLFSYLTGKPYQKYRYVQASAFRYSFYPYTDYAAPEDQQELEEDLRKEHYLAEDGRLLRKPGIETPEPPQATPFTGNAYVLTSGWTYSGGAEFCSLMREHTNATFVGEEAGGGFYGNTSGYSITLTLPHSGLKIEIPLLKFVLDVHKNIPEGRGVIPDYEVEPGIKQFLAGKDLVMEYADSLINKNRSAGGGSVH